MHKVACRKTKTKSSGCVYAFSIRVFTEERRTAFIKLNVCNLRGGFGSQNNEVKG